MQAGPAFRIVGVLTFVVLLSGCGESSTVTDPGEPARTTSTSTSVAVDEQTTSTVVDESTTSSAPDADDGSTSTTEPTVTSTSEASTSTTLPGEPFDIVPPNGTSIAVIGVVFDDVLNVRSGPGTNFAVVASLAPTATMLSTGEARLLPGSIWYEISTGNTTGWVNSSFTGMLGEVDDVTSEIVAALGETPSAETMLELGSIAAQARASIEPPSRITITVAPTVGDLGEVTYDVVGIGDDSVLGERLHIFGQPVDGGSRFSLMSVESQILCGRGVTAEGLCI